MHDHFNAYGEIILDLLPHKNGSMRLMIMKYGSKIYDMINVIEWEMAT